MKKTLYTDEDVRRLRKRIGKYAALCIALVGTAVAVGVTTCFFVTDANAKTLKTVNIVFSAACGCVALYFLFNYLLPARARKNYTEQMLRSTVKTVRGRVAGKGRKITLVKHLSHSELRLYDEAGKEIVLYWDDANGETAFEGHIVEFQVVNNKIVGYGDAL